MKKFNLLLAAGVGALGVQMTDAIAQEATAPKAKCSPAALNQTDCSAVKPDPAKDTDINLKKFGNAINKKTNNVTLKSEAIRHAEAVAKSCIDNWMSRECHVSLSASAQTLTRYYNAELFVKGRILESIRVLEDCAKATSMTLTSDKVPDPANEFRICANAINETSNATGIIPNKDLMQLLVAPDYCYTGKITQCMELNSALKPYLK